MDQKKIFKIFSFIIFSSAFLISAIFYPSFFSITKAGLSHNVFGWAWSENIGWISFNSINCDANGDGISDGLISGCPPAGTITGDYGVTVDTATGDFSGYAWSENIGWISFDRTATGNPPAAPFGGGNGAIAKYNRTTGEITGWMRVLANGGGWDGWVRFYDAALCAKSAMCNAATDVARVVAGDWQGWAWSDLVTGWIKLKGNAQDGSPYKVVFNVPPIAENLRNNITADFYCNFSPSEIVLSWDFNDPGDIQSAYQVRITRSDGATYDSAKNSGGVTSITALRINSEKGGNFVWYSYIYNWEVRVWDSNGAYSPWATASFSTPIHAWPAAAGFTWSPSSPSAGEIVTFSPPAQPAAVDPVWSWNIPRASYQNGTDSFSKNPQVIFSSKGTYAATLTISDRDHPTFVCSATRSDINVNLPLPGWQEK